MNRVPQHKNNLRRQLLAFLLLLLPSVFAATGFDYPNPTTLRLFNDGSLKDFCINTTSGIALENCGYDWANTTWCVSTRRNANPWVFHCTDSVPFVYRVESDNLTYANATFHMAISGGHSFIVNYNLTKQAAFIDVQPNFTIGGTVPSNTTARFHIIQKGIKINDTVANNRVYFDNKTYNLSAGGTNNTANTTNESTLAIYREEDSQQIFYGWNTPYSTKLTVWPQPGWANRQLNLTFDFGVVGARKSYVVPLKWNDLEVACTLGTTVFSVMTSLNTTKYNFTSIDQFKIVTDIFKSGFGSCTYYLYYKTTSAAKFALVPSSMTGVNIDLPVGRTVGNTSVVTTTLSRTTWTVQLGGMNTSWGNSNAFKNFTFQVNVSGVTDSSGEAFDNGWKTVAVWDTRPPNMSITSNNSNWTNWTLGNIFIYGWSNDETNDRVIELYSNETGAWKLTDWLNASTNAINKTLFKNFSRSLPSGCYLYGFRAMDTTLDAVSNKYNVTQNLTMCVNTSGIIVASIKKPQVDFIPEDEEEEFLPTQTETGNFNMMENFIFLGFIIGGSAAGGMLLKKEEEQEDIEEEEDSWGNEDEEWESALLKKSILLK